MSEYFSQIASRNVPDGLPVLMPATPIIEKTNSDPFQEDISIIPNNPFSMPTSKSFENSGGFQDRKIENAKTEEGPPNQFVDTPYFTKHIERITISEKKNFTKHNISQNTTEGMDRSSTNFPLPKDLNAEDGEVKQIISIQPANNDLEGKREVPNSEIKYTLLNPASTGFNYQDYKPDTAELNELGPKPVASEKKPMLKPSFKEEIFKDESPYNKTPGSSILQPVQQAPIPVSTRNNTPPPKLVIGKITVEIMPPERPAPPKVVQRVMHSPLGTNQSMPSKLSFGLGQL